VHKRKNLVPIKGISRFLEFSGGDAAPKTLSYSIGENLKRPFALNHYPIKVNGNCPMVKCRN
jgi:hypothetical protein